MRNSTRMLTLVLLISALACRSSQIPLNLWKLPTPTPGAVSLQPTATHTPAMQATATETQESLPPTPSSAPSPAPIPAFSIRFHPDDRLYAGDQVSIEVIAPPGVDLRQKTLTVGLKGEPAPLGSAPFQPYGFDGRIQATFYWVWNTAGISGGDYTLEFSLPDNGWRWEETVSLLPSGALPTEEKNARWQTIESQCCNLYYISGSAAGRDIDLLEQAVDEQFESVHQVLPAELTPPLGIVFLPRVLGHGGFANQEVSVSYLDRNYTGGDTVTILHHEIVHALDAKMQGKYRPSLFVEGVAVYLSGGHYQTEPLLPRAAGLLPLGRYILLEDLADNFYHEQHELSYLEAGALVEFMVQRWGWQAFQAFYRDIDSQNNEKASVSIHRALEKHFGISLAGLEQEFVAALSAEEVSESTLRDVRSLAEYYDTIRLYQQLLDPSAYFKTGWMLDAAEMRRRGIVADYWRRPSDAINLTAEILLNRAGRARQSGDFSVYDEYLGAVRSLLEEVQAGNPQPAGAHPLAERTWQLVQTLRAAGYEPQKVDELSDTAIVWATRLSPNLLEIHLRFQSGQWEIRAVIQR